MRLPTPLWSSSGVGHRRLCDDKVPSEMKMLALAAHQMLPEHCIKAYSALRNASAAVCNISSFYSYNNVSYSKLLANSCGQIAFYTVFPHL